jgi:uncharacterized integral membrane protein (TIGR00698 family)
MRLPSWLAGSVLAVGIALPATTLGALVPIIGPPTMAIASGAVVAAALRQWWPSLSDRCVPGLAVSARIPLQLAILAMGFGFSIRTALTVGSQSLPVLLGTLAIATVGAILLGKLLALHRESILLIGVGTAICGASAIAAVTAVVRPATYRVGYAVATIFVFNILAVLAYPPLGRLLHLSQQSFGVWAGTAINDTSSVLAAASAFGAVAVQYAVVVKLVRSLAIIPLCVGLHLGRRGEADTASAWRSFPWFILAFVGASVVASTGILTTAAQDQLSGVARFLITVALAAVGTTLSGERVRSAGVRPMVFGGLLAALVAVTGLAILPVGSVL